MSILDAHSISMGYLSGMFVRQIDKICTPSHYRHGSDASSEGVQRDLLPIIEGCTVTTKHGNINTSHILFIARCVSRLWCICPGCP